MHRVQLNKGEIHLFLDGDRQSFTIISNHNDSKKKVSLVIFFFPVLFAILNKFPLCSKSCHRDSSFLTQVFWCRIA